VPWEIFSRYLYLSWALAIGLKTKKRRGETTLRLERERMQMLCTATPEEARLGDEEPLLYDEHRAALFIHLSKFWMKVNDASGRYLLLPDRKVYPRLTVFFDQHKPGLPFRVDALLPADQKFVKRTWGIDDVPYAGRILFGAKPRGRESGRLIIAIRDSPYIDPATLYDQVMKEAGPPHFLPFTPPPPGAWTAHAERNLQIGVSRELCEDMATLLREDASLLPAALRTSRRTIIKTFTDGADARVVAAALAHERIDQETGIVVCTDASAADAAETIRTVRHDLGLPAFTCMILGREEITQTALAFPWLANAHIQLPGITIFRARSPSDAIDVLRRPTTHDADRVWSVATGVVDEWQDAGRRVQYAQSEQIIADFRASLRHTPYDLDVHLHLPLEDATHEKVLRRLVAPVLLARFPLLSHELHSAARRCIKPGTRTLLTGMPGSGKSTTALLAIAHRVVPKEGVPVTVLVIHPSAAPQFVTALLKDLRGPVAIVVEDIDQHAGRAAVDTLLHTVLGAVAAHATIIATATRTDDAFERTYERTLRDERVTPATLDARDAVLDEAIIDHCARSLRIVLDDDRWNALYDRIGLEAGTRILGMIRWTVDQLGFALIEDEHEEAEVEWWRARLQELPATERELAVAIATFSWLDDQVPPIPLAWIRAFYDPRPIEPMLTTVVSTGLITRAGGILQVPRGPRRAIGALVHMGEPFHSPYLHLAEWLLQTTSIEVADRVRLLEQVRKLLWWKTHKGEAPATEILREDNRVALYDRVERKIKQLQRKNRSATRPRA
jgi:hypothetical protein